MKKFSFIALLLIATGCIIKEEMAHKSVLECNYSTIVDSREKVSKIKLFFTSKEVLDKYEYSAMTKYNEIDYSHFKGLDEESKRDFVFDDENMTITYTKTDTAPFSFDHPSSYDDVENYYLNKAYTCNGKESKQINLKEVMIANKNYIFFKNRVFFNDPYNYNYLTSTNLDGKDKEVIVSENVNILFGLGDYLYVKKIDNSVTTYAKINALSKTDIVSLGDLVTFKEEELYDSIGRENAFIKTSIFNEEANSIISSKKSFYKNIVIENNKNEVIYNSEVLYKGASISNLFIYRNFLIFNDSNKIIKYDLETKKAVSTLNFAQVIKASSSAKDAVYLTKDGLYSLDFEQFVLNSLDKKINNVLEFSLYDNKLIYSTKSNSDVSDLLDVHIFDMDSKILNSNTNLINYQISFGNVYIVTIDGKFELK